MIRRLRWKFILIAMLSLLTVLAVIMITINVLSYKGVVSRADETLDIIAERQGRFPVLPQMPGFPQYKEWEREIPVESRFFFVSFTKNMEPVSVITGNITVIDAEDAINMAERALKNSKERDFFGNYRYLIKKDRNFINVIFLDCSSALSTNRNFALISVLISAIGSLAVFMLLFFLSKLVTEPVSESVEKQKRFITDAGHELKTPLTVIDADAELIAMENGDSEWLTDIKQQTKRLAALTNDLIYLSRMEEEGYKLPFVEFPISDLAHEITQSFVSLFRANGKTVDIRIESMLTVKGDEKSITQLMSIMLDNASKYSPDGDTVEIELKRQGKYVSFAVVNGAEGITQDRAERLFDRFYRGDVSREERSGYGLGLSIAKAIVTSHKGKITANVRDGERLEISAFLPI